jgi:hypothetical protein
VGYFCLFLNICHAPRCQPSCKRFDGELHREETILTFWKAGRSGTVIPERAPAQMTPIMLFSASAGERWTR